jgi:hypothetical protein
MKKLLLGATALILTACATGPTAYGPTGPESAFGFNEYPIENDRFRVSYTGRTAAEAHDYALLRSAEIALDQGYSHFKIVNGALSGDENRESPVSTSVGIGIGSGRGYRGYYSGRSRTNVGIGIGIHDLGRALGGNKVTQSFEILLRNGGGDDPDIYSASSITESIKPDLFK